MDDGRSRLGNRTHALACAIVGNGSGQRSDIFRNTAYEHIGNTY